MRISAKKSVCLSVPLLTTNNNATIKNKTNTATTTFFNSISSTPSFEVIWIALFHPQLPRLWLSSYFRMEATTEIQNIGFQFRPMKCFTKIDKCH